METVSIDNNITVFYVAAASFPNGVLAAHTKIRAVAPPSPGRKYFGLSRPENGVIAYKAAAAELSPEEASTLNLDKIVLKKGKYLCITIHDFIKDTPAIRNAFQELIGQPGLDPQGYCVEWYYNDADIKCMVRLAE